MTYTRNCQKLVSSILNPVKKVPKGVKSSQSDHILSNSQKLLLDNGFIKSSGLPGQFQFLPLGVIVLQKLISVIDNAMQSINAQKTIMPTMSSGSLWRKSGRMEALGQDMYVLKDRSGKELCLGPTYEEVMTDLVASLHNPSYKMFPLKLYQITRKYRDEINPRFGLLRGREFYMKDLYSFDIDLNEAHKTYEQVCTAYESIFKELNLDIIKVEGDTGIMGGLSSHEFQILSSFGEDKLNICPSCKTALNSELINDGSNVCKKCSVNYEVHSGIEIGHTFILGDKYSELFGAKFTDESSSVKNLQMGCYGIGVSRLLAAAVEVKCDGEFIQWPNAIAPYKFCIIPPKKGSKEDSAASMVKPIFESLSSKYKNDVIIDDRSTMTIGQRILMAKKIGYPFIIICGKSVLQKIPRFEFIDVYNKTEETLTHSELMYKLIHT